MIVDRRLNTKNPHPFLEPLGGYVLQMGVLVRKVLMLLEPLVSPFDFQTQQLLNFQGCSAHRGQPGAPLRPR